MVCMCAGGARVEDAESASGCGRGGHRRHPEGVLRRPEGGGAQSSAQVSQSAGVQDYYTVHVYMCGMKCYPQCLRIHMYMYNIHVHNNYTTKKCKVCMYMFLNERRKKERSKQGQTNKQGKATQHTQGSHFS